jgi:tRNA threonylcarbamoyladenosine biosynthesis protein TsaB
VILAIDTTHEYGSLALLRGEAIVEEMELHSPDGFGHVLFPHLAALLERNGCALEEIGCFAAASGPGSFTGVRIGIACVKGLAEVAGRPVVGVSNLEALATFGSGVLRAAVLDARRGEVYGGVYDAAGNLVRPETVTNFAAWLETLPEGIELVSTDFAPFAATLETSRFAAAPLTTAPRALAAAVGRIASRRLRAGLAIDPALLDANYVRRSDAELMWKE